VSSTLLSDYLVLGAILFTVGIAGVLTRKNPLIVFMSVELMLNSVNLTLITFSRLWGSVDGQIIALFVLVVAAAEVVVGLAIIVTIFRARDTVDIDDVHTLQG
jgi:NADH-quinone oxidoreductase subunit K